MCYHFFAKKVHCLPQDHTSRTNYRKIIGRNHSMVIPLLSNQDLKPMLVKIVISMIINTVAGNRSFCKNWWKRTITLLHNYGKFSVIQYDYSINIEKIWRLNPVWLIKKLFNPCLRHFQHEENIWKGHIYTRGRIRIYVWRENEEKLKEAPGYNESEREH